MSKPEWEEWEQRTRERIEEILQEAKEEWKAKKALLMMAFDALEDIEKKTGEKLTHVQVCKSGFGGFLGNPSFLWETDRFELFYGDEGDGCVYHCMAILSGDFPKSLGKIKLYREKDGHFERYRDGIWMPSHFEGKKRKPGEVDEHSLASMREGVLEDFADEEPVFEAKKALLQMCLEDCIKALQKKNYRILRMAVKAEGVEDFAGSCYGSLDIWEDEPLFLFDIEGKHVHVARLEREEDYEGEEVAFQAYIYEDFEGYDYADPEKYKKKEFWEDYEPNWDEEEITLESPYLIRIY